MAHAVREAAVVGPPTSWLQPTCRQGWLKAQERLLPPGLHERSCMQQAPEHTAAAPRPTCVCRLLLPDGPTACQHLAG